LLSSLTDLLASDLPFARRHIAKTHGDKLFAVFSLYGPMPAKLDLLVQRLRLPNERLPAHVAHNELLKQGIKV